MNIRVEDQVAKTQKYPFTPMHNINKHYTVLLEMGRDVLCSEPVTLRLHESKTIYVEISILLLLEDSL